MWATETCVGTVMDLWLFWAVAVALTVAVAVLLLQALRQGEATQEEHPDLKVYRDQLSEVERDLQRGTLTPEEAQRLRIEVSRRLLDADRALQAKAPVMARGNVVWAGVVVLAMLGGSVWLYDRIGAPGYADLPLNLRLAMADAAYAGRPSQATAVAATPQVEAPDPGPEFTELMTKLRAAIAERPDDVVGLELLARNESALGNYLAALAAQTRLVEVKGDKATSDERVMVAQLMVAAAGGYVSPEAEAVLTDVLAKDPRNGMARYLSGLMFAQVGRPDRAFQLWQPLIDEGPADAPWVEAVMTDIQAVAEEAGVRFEMPAPKGPSAADMAAAADMTAEDRQAMIEGMVGQLETRLFSDGGSVEEWVQLLNAVQVLGQPERGVAALRAAEAALAADPAALQVVRDAASAAGIAP